MKERPNESAATADFEFQALREANNYRKALLKMFAPHLRGRVIEIGAGIGQLTDQLCRRPEIEHLLAIEPDPRFCAVFRKSLPDQPLIEGTITSLSDPEPWNGIVSVNVLEHIRDDQDELALYAKLLGKSCGRLCLFVPARQEIYGPIEIDFGHHRRYSRKELQNKLETAGFKIVELHYFNLVGYFGWWLTFCLLQRRQFNVGMVRFFDRIIFPCSFALESHICWPPFGQSLVAVAEAGE
jgi:SAM-dependent methyltransferase